MHFCLDDCKHCCCFFLKYASAHNEAVQNRFCFSNFKSQRALARPHRVNIKINTRYTKHGNCLKRESRDWILTRSRRRLWPPGKCSHHRWCWHCSWSPYSAQGSYEIELRYPRFVHAEVSRFRSDAVQLITLQLKTFLRQLITSFNALPSKAT